MEIIQWKDEYSVGVSKLDSQHKRLFNIINKLISHPVSTADINLISQTLKEMVNYAKEHFTDEEELMQKYGFPEIQQQRKQHAYFVNTTTELALNVLNDGQKTGDEIAEFLRTWLTIHILKWDMKYKEFFKSKIHAAAATAV